MQQEGKKYILIGPGRWGTRDKFIGIPVVWSQISNAAVIVEIGLKDFPLEASLGSHFFHNLTSMNVGYLSIADNTGNNFINWKTLDQQPIINQTEYFKHVEFKNPLQIIMNGKKMKSAVVADDLENTGKMDNQIIF